MLCYACEDSQITACIKHMDTLILIAKNATANEFP